MCCQSWLVGVVGDGADLEPGKAVQQRHARLPQRRDEGGQDVDVQRLQARQLGQRALQHARQPLHRPELVQPHHLQVHSEQHTCDCTAEAHQRSAAVGIWPREACEAAA